MSYRYFYYNEFIHVLHPSTYRHLLGSGRSSPWLFTILSGVSAAIWSLLITIGAYHGGRLFSDALQAGLAAQKWLVLAGGLVVAVVLIGRYLWKGQAGR